MTKPKDLQRWVANLQGERNGAALYDALADAEHDPHLSEVYRKLAAVERKHSQLWAGKIESAGAAVPEVRLSSRTRMLSWIARRFGVSNVIPLVLSLEQTDTHSYDQQPDASHLAADEKSHARVLRQIRRSMPEGVEGSDLARLEGRHRIGGGNALRAAVLGANDGLVSNLSLVMGVAGAEMSPRAILVTGIAGLLAGAGSMALGEWLSVQSSRELYLGQIATEEEEIANAPEEEAEELALIYQARGLDEAQARSVARDLMSNPGSALQTLAREELGVDPGSLGGSAWQAAATSFVLFAVGAIVPVIPYFFLAGSRAVLVSVGLSMLALFGLGAGITLFTGRPVWRSGLRQVTFGLAAAALTFVIGRLIGVGVS